MPRSVSFLIVLVLFCSPTLAQPSPSQANHPGRYTDGKDYVVYFEETQFGMTMRPALWTATQLLKQTGADDFTVVDRTERGAKFQRDSQGQIIGVTIRGMEGEGLQLTLATQTPLPIEVLLSGRGETAARRYLAEVNNDPDRITNTAERVLARFPSKSSAVVAFLSTAARRFPQDTKLATLLGFAYVEAGKRHAALSALQRAYRLDRNNKDAISGLARLHALPISEGTKDTPWQLRFPLGTVFRPPSVAEIQEVEADWRARDLAPRDVTEVATGTIKFGDDDFDVRIVSHLIRGQRHYGAIIVPVDAKPNCCPVIVEAKGVSWNYFHLDLEHVDSPGFMGDARRQFIYVVPSFRGEVLHFNGVDYQSEGDRTNAWDGATDDALALLNVALKTTPSADANRVCAFGRSRGGSVVLLMGERDSRIKCVVEWSGPADWFSLMGTEGWTQQELFAEGLRTQAKPDETGGQLLEHFLLKAVRGEEDLRAVRHRMIASSPLYFTTRLPSVQLHYGIEDTSVPVRNGMHLAARLRLSHQNTSAALVRTDFRSALAKSKALVMRRGPSQAFFYPGQGHDTDRLLAPALSREFLIHTLLRTAK